MQRARAGRREVNPGDKIETKAQRRAARAKLLGIESEGETESKVNPMGVVQCRQDEVVPVTVNKVIHHADSRSGLGVFDEAETKLKLGYN